ncbi:MAG: PqqD family peptide modification chaperone [Comamonadaceae bacterium]|nr:MAG: PqqD family peptide modification chaperone [Comamonadaceae bacterium]
MTTEILHSAAWHRVAGLRPALAAGTRIVRQPARDLVWHLVVEPGTGRLLRLNPAAWAFVGRLDGRSTVDGLWRRLLALQGEQAPTQDEVLQLLAQLARAGLVVFDAAPHLSMLFERREEAEVQRRGGRFNPFMLRLPLFDPQPWLDRLEHVGRVLFSRPACIAWLLGVLAALATAAVQWPELTTHAGVLVATPANALLAWLAYPLVKLVHETAHGLAVRRFGGEVHEAGIGLVLLVPSPYVDAAAASAFGSRRHRILVSAAGLLVEGAIAAIALFVWTLVQPGLVRDAALAVALVCSVSTVLFNANPLVRLDGYHILCDALDLPNLSTRSRAWWTRLLGRLLAGRSMPQASLMAGEAKWLAVYAPAALVYRLLVLVGVALWAGSHSWVLGLGAGLVAATWLLRSGWRWLGVLGPRAQAVGGAAAAFTALLVAIVPAPEALVAQGVVWPAANAQVRAATSGFVQALALPDGAPVEAGAVVLRLDDPALNASLDSLQAQQLSLRAQQFRVMLSDPSSYVQLESDLQRVSAEAAEIERRIGGLEVRAAASGTLAWTRPQDAVGGFAGKGALLGYVVTGDPTLVRLALPEDDYLPMQGRVTGVQVRLADSRGTAWDAELLPVVPGAGRELPSAALGSRQGGAIAVEAGNPSRALGRVVLLDVRVPQLHSQLVGGRAWVKLQLAPQPLATRWWLRLRQLLLRQFAPTGQL